MKNLITIIGCIMLLFAFIIQFTQNQIVYSKIVQTDHMINTFKEVAKQEGCISDKNELWIKEQLSKTVDCTHEEVIVEGTRKTVKRGEKIYYKVSIPVKELVGNAEFWGLAEKENKFIYTVERYTTSEFI